MWRENFFTCVWIILLSTCCRSLLTSTCCHTIAISASSGTLCTELGAGAVCRNLQNVLLLIAEQSGSVICNGNASLPCTEVIVSSGEYVLTEVVKIESHNVIIRASEPGVRIEFNVISGLDVADAVLSFRNADLVHINGIIFCGSPGVIAIDDISKVVLNATTYSYFSQGAVDIFNCLQVYATWCVFENNGPILNPRSQPFRGQSGGLSVGFNYTQRMADVALEVVVSDCIFYNNSAMPKLTIPLSRSNFQRSVFTGRGGASSIILISAVSVYVMFEKCTFKENNALSFGGAIYISTQNLAPHSVTVNNSRFIGNFCPEAGGGIYYTVGQSPDLSRLYTFLVVDSQFIDNRADFGGGLYIITGGRISLVFDGTIYFFGRLANCLFRGNVASLFGGGCACSIPNAEVSYQNTQNVDPIEFDNCTFTENKGGALSTAFFPIEFHGSTAFTRNMGQALVIAGALVRVYGTVEFIENVNTGSDQGAVYVTSFGQMELFHGAAVRFLNNQGNVGAALVLDNPFAPPSFLAKLFYNPLCFFLFENRTISPLQIDNDAVEISFSGNTAVIGSAVYARNLDFCSWTQLRQEPFFNISASFRWGFMQYSEDNCNSAHVGDECNSKWHIQTPAVELNITSSSVVSVYPGEPFSLGVELYDELGELTADVLSLSDETPSLQLLNASGSEDDDFYVFNSSVISYDTIDGLGVGLYFNSLRQSKSSQAETIYINTAITGSHFSSAESFEVEAGACPAGYLLTLDQRRLSSFRCQCNLNNTDILNCNGRSVQLLEGLWGMVANDSGELSLATYQCPPEYCRCTPQTVVRLATCSFVFRELDPNAQCNCNRAGVLCGECRDGRGVSVQLNRCVSCHNAYSVLIAFLVLCDVVVFIAMLLLLSEMPAWLYPCLFYLQILPYITENFPITFETFHQPIYTVTGALSFYFVYDFCVYSSLSPLVSYFLRLVPLLTSLLVCPIVIVIRKHLNMHKRHGVWWIVLLHYPHIVYTALSVLNCPSLPGEDGQTSLRWYISGSVECFRGWHIALGLLALAVLVLCVVLIALPLCTALRKKQTQLTYFTEPLVLEAGGSGVRYEWWGAMELCRRLLLLLFVVAFPRNDFPVLVVLMLILVLYGLLQPYTAKATTALEVFLSANTLLLILLRNTQQTTEQLSIKDLRSADNQSDSTCMEHVLETTGFAWLLSPFYYTPLITFALAVCWWTVHRIGYLMISRTKRKRMKTKGGGDDLELLSVSVHEPTSAYYSVLDVPEGDSTSTTSEGAIQLEYQKFI